MASSDHYVLGSSHCSVCGKPSLNTSWKHHKSSSIYRFGNWGPEMFSNFPKVEHPRNSGAEVWSLAVPSSLLPTDCKTCSGKPATFTNFLFPDPSLGAERASGPLWRAKGKYFPKSEIRAPKLAEARAWLAWQKSGYKEICWGQNACYWYILAWLIV